MTEEAYEEGKIIALMNIIEHCKKELIALGYEVPTDIRGTERADVIKTLRVLCSQHGDNEWPDGLHVSDIIEKHLIAHLLA